MTLRWQIALALAVIAGLVGSAAATGSYLTTAQRLRSNVDDSLVATATTLTTGGNGRDGDRRRGPGGCPEPGLLQPASAAQLVTEEEQVTSCLTGAPVLPVPDEDQEPPSGSVQLRTVSVDGRSYRVATARWPEGGVIEIGRDLDEATRVLRTLRLQLALITLLGVALASLGGWLLANRLVRPVVGLRDAAERIADTQDLSTPVPGGGSGEVGSLAASFTAMVTALRRSRDQQQRLVDDASHEMRTPLTSLTTNLELLHRLEQLPPDERREVLAAVQLDVHELTHLLTELVELATDRSADDEPVEPVDLVDVAEQVAQRAARRSGRSIRVVEDGPAGGGPVDDAAPGGAPAGTGTGAGTGEATLVPARPHMIERAVSNLVENAVKYSPEGSPVEVHVAGGRLEVRDHGAGIAEHDQALVFERFYRSVESRSEPGSGLGLAIVRQIVDRHGGRVWAGTHPDGGGVVGFELPAR